MALYRKKTIIPLWDAYADLEHEFVMAVAELLKKPGLLERWRQEPFAAQQELQDELNRLAGAKFNRTVRRDLKAAFEKNAKSALSNDERIYKVAVKEGLVQKAPAPVEASPALQKIIERHYLATVGTLNTAAKVAGVSTVARLDQAIMATAGGQVSIDRAIREAARELAASGVAGYIYPNGRKIGLTEYVRREIVTRVMNTTRQLSWARAEEYGSNLILTSAHAWARPGCFPYQGRVFSRPGVIERGYQSLEHDTSYGEPDGIFGINCRHFSVPWFEGLNDVYSEIEKNPAQELKMDNEAIYKLTQEQRYNERQIRAWKRRAAAQEEAGLDPARARRKVKQWQKVQRDFLKANEILRRDYEREAA